MTLSNDYNINTKFKYGDRKTKITISAANTGVAEITSNTDLRFLTRLVDENGTTVQSTDCTSFSNLTRQLSYTSDGDFGVSHGLTNVSTFDFAGGIDRGNISGSVYVEHYPLHWWGSKYQDPTFPVQTQLADSEQKLPYNTSLPWGTAAEGYEGSPIIIKGGDAVVRGTVSTVTNQKDITLSTVFTRRGTSYSTQTVAPAIVEVVSGANQGDVFYCSSQSSSTLTVDGDASALSGQAVRVMPLREVTNYGGYSFNPAVYFGSGFSGPTAQFELNDYIPIDVGSFTFTGNGGWTTDNINISSGCIDWVSLEGRPTSYVFSEAVANLQDYCTISGRMFELEAAGGRLPTIGSVLKYTSTLGNTETGVVAFIDNDTSAGYAVRVGIYPPGSATADTTQDLTIYNPNTFDVLCYPNFDSDYSVEFLQAKSRSGPTLVAGNTAFADAALSAFGYPPAIQNPRSTDINSVIALYTGLMYEDTEVATNYIRSARTPSADIEITANEYESQFTTVTETTNFHVGPIHLSNGEVLTDSDLSALKLPVLNISLAVQGGDPTALSSYVDDKLYMTQTADIAHRYNGQYTYNGQAIFTESTAFNSSETLHCIASGSYGSAVVRKVIGLPVQPSV